MRYLIATAFAAGCFTSLSYANEAYAPKIDPANFSTEITNPMYSMPVGKKLVFEGKTEEGLEHEEITISGETKTIMGVNALLVLDVSKIDGVIVEIAKDYVAQDKEGNVWYFGEEVDNFENGKLKDHHGSWLAGKNGALPGIWMQAKLTPGQSYREEYYKGEAEDMGRVISTGDIVKTKAGTFNNCTKILEWTPLEPEALEMKYYCTEVAGPVLTENLVNGDHVGLTAN